MRRILISCLLVLLSTQPGATLEMRESVRRFFADPIVNRRDLAEYNALCGDQIVPRLPGYSWIPVDDLTLETGPGTGAEGLSVSFRPTGWTDDLNGLSGTPDRVRIQGDPSTYARLTRSKHGLLALQRQGHAGWVVADLLTARELETGIVGTVDRSGRLRAAAWSAVAAARTLVRTEGTILSEPLRDRLRSGAFIDLGHPDLADFIVLYAGGMRAIELWRKRASGRLPGEVEASNFAAALSPIAHRLRVEAITEEQQAIAASAPSKAEAAYRVAVWIDRNADGLYASGELSSQRSVDDAHEAAMRRLDEALAEDPDHIGAQKLKLELLFSSPRPLMGQLLDREIEVAAGRLAVLAPDDPLPKQVAFAMRARPPAPTPDGVPLPGLRASSIDLSGADLAGADLSRLWVRSVEARGADLRGANLRLIPPERTVGRPALLNLQSAFDFYFLEEAKLDGAQIADRSLAVTLFRTSMRGVRMERTDLVSLEPRDVDLRDTTLTAVSIGGLVWENIDFSGSRFSEVSVKNIIFNGTNFNDVQFADTRFDHVTFEGIDFSRNDLSKVAFSASRYDCGTRFPPGFSPERAGLLPVADRCAGEKTPKNLTLSGRCRMHLDYPALPGTILDGLTCGFEDLPRELAGVSMRHATVKTDIEDVDLTDADLTGIHDDGSRFHQSICRTRALPLFSTLLRARSLDRAKLRGVTLQLFDMAAITLRLPEEKLTNALGKLARADLRGAVLKCGRDPHPDTQKGWHAVAAAAEQEQRRFLAVLRQNKGVIVDPSCAKL